jgi:hypothetical protein
MDFSFTAEQQTIRAAIERTCARFSASIRQNPTELQACAHRVIAVQMRKMSALPQGEFMPQFLKCALRAVALTGLLVGFAGAAAAQTFERPPTFDPARILGPRASGPNYSVASPITSDGFMRIYTVRTPYGEFAVVGDALMQTRLQELAALYHLDKVKPDAAFGKSFVESGLAPVTYAGKMLTDPAKTIGSTFAGIGNFFGQIGSGLHNAGKTQDDPMAALFGVTKKKRELAAELHVDPYTDFQPLAIRMTRLSEAAAGASLTVGVGYAFIPGVAGAVISNVGTSSDMSEFARDYSAAQLMDMCRQKLTVMGLDRQATEALLTNRAFSPLDLLAMLNALEKMADVEGRVEFLRRAVPLQRRDAAFFMRRQAEVLADYHGKTRALAAFVSYGDFPFNRTRNGGVLGLWPIDALSWTENAGPALQKASEALKRSGHKGPAEIRISGQATNLTKQRLKALGWTVTDNVKL